MTMRVEDWIVESNDRFKFVLGEIARGRCDNGRPLAAEVARQMARHVLDTYGVAYGPSLRDGEFQSERKE